MSAEVGSKAPEFTLTNQDRQQVSLGATHGKTVVLAFFPAAFTSVCQKELCHFRDELGSLNSLNATVYGISVDTPFTLKEFAKQNSLNFDLLSDLDHSVAEGYGVWVEKKNYGKTYMGIERSAFLVGPDGTLRNVWYKISPKDTPVRLLEALAG